MQYAQCIQQFCYAIKLQDKVARKKSQVCDIGLNVSLHYLAKYFGGRFGQTVSE